ncbi:MAG: hypothetical protein A2589_01655 [Candidatus Vogelbacteria bacterium RIFOXYD1_FULL_46_19]|uniref:GH18 domain-containing protein n=1 Tax=Candidatus Vogelbacteria bacterium RIFOXYD1_FULL_46_19 TaxID=1802439 RepID=A0A1G2QGL4_9BACT|nr:MAG: hypothetical protein A2589_01655 [Candidatus Vogelbacteria bacterium RIFOXYD1_FULL_46_19]
MTKNLTLLVISALLLFIIVITGPTAEAKVTNDSDLEVAGWVPYWRLSEGSKSAKRQLKKLDTIYPFVYSVTTDGELKDLGNLKNKDWQRLAKAAKTKRVEIIPTVMWSGGADIHRLLSDPELRQNHIKAITKMVRKGKYAGVDIDYEGKQAATKDYFSLFLAELKSELGQKKLVCTIEARTPPASLYRVLPPVIAYANDYEAIGEHCDVVQIMAYDQQRADILLNDERKGAPYAPTADVDWVRKVVELTTATIPAEKIMLGIPTYGAEYEIVVSPNWYQRYSKLWALNPEYGLDTAKKFKTEPSRNQAGELSLSYQANPTLAPITSLLSVPKNTPRGEVATAQALSYANLTGQTVTVNYLSWSDSGAVKAKIDLARELGLRGVSLFKIDGGEDKKIWSLF